MFRQSVWTASAAVLFLLTEGAVRGAEPVRGFELTGPADAVRLAELHFSNGNVVQFIGSLEDQEVYYAETTPAGPDEAFFFGGEDGTALERFLALTPDSVPVPRMLIEAIAQTPAGNPEPGDGGATESGAAAPAVVPAPQPANAPWREQLSRRAVVEQLASPVYVHLSSLKIDPQPTASGGSCGSDGADYFEEHHCGTWDWHGYGKGEGYCYEDGWDWIQKTSDDPMRVTYSRTAACGAGGTTKHSRNTATGFKVKLTGVQSANTVMTLWSTTSGVKWKRRVRFETNDPDDGFVRGWVHYFDKITE
jgi:hypothetical protein